MADPDDVRSAVGPGDIRRDHVDVVSTAASFAGKEVHVLADPAEVRIVVLGNYRDAKRSRWNTCP
jgi:hypothetical protein